ncbi:MAG: hypothetical protein HQK60_16245 [Deltaproteobacteria bacterium]|nr:hypothetical protein [Deltaproteobacteria bacterium]
MHKYPFTLIRITVTDVHGNPVFKRPLWLIVVGKRRSEIDLVEAWQAYSQRYDVEHFFRFGKARCLMNSYQTPEVEHEENWYEIAALAYAQLWAAATLAVTVPRPWERYRPISTDPRTLPGPAMVQRDFGRITRQFGTPAASPKPRGKSLGREKGYSPGKRTRQPIIFKGTKTGSTLAGNG